MFNSEEELTVRNEAKKKRSANAKCYQDFSFDHVFHPSSSQVCLSMLCVLCMLCAHVLLGTTDQNPNKKLKPLCICLFFLIFRLFVPSPLTITNNCSRLFSMSLQPHPERRLLRSQSHGAIGKVHTPETQVLKHRLTYSPRFLSLSKGHGWVSQLHLCLWPNRFR